MYATTNDNTQYTIFFQSFATPVNTYTVGGTSTAINNTSASVITFSLSVTITINASDTVTFTGFNFNVFFF
jgi:hypothetical protein